MAHSKKAEKALNEKDEGNIPDTTPVTDEKPAEEVAKPEVKAEGKEAETEEKVPEEVSPKKEAKKGYSKRVRELVKEREEEKAKSQSLAEKLAELTGSVEPQVGYQQPTTSQEPIVRPGEEIDAAELEKRLQAREQRTLQKADALAILRSKQQNVVNRIDKEASDAVKDYPQLDPESDSFDKELSEAVTEAVEAHVRADPFKSSVKKFVGKLMKPYKRAVTKEVGKATENLAKQVSETALRPISVKPKEKKADDKTVKELEEELGVVY